MTDYRDLSPEVQAYHQECLDEDRRLRMERIERAIAESRCQPSPLRWFGFVVALVALVAIVVCIATAADAHTPTVEASCRVLTVELTQYEPASTVAITVDGATDIYSFASDWRKSIPWDASKAHVWRVVVDNRGDGVRDQWDQTFTGTTAPCVAPSTTTSTTVPPTTTTAAPVITPPVVVAAVIETPAVAPAVRIAFNG